MALGSITSLGVGSGFELQDILDKLRQTDEITVNLKKAEKTRLEAQVTEFDSINARLIQMKSSALSLSLESNFLERSAGVSDEEIISADVISGTELSSYNIDVKRLASKSSFQSIGFEKQDSIFYAAPVLEFTTPDEPVVTEKTILAFTIGQGEEQKNISVDIAAGSNLKEIAKAVNSAADNLDEDGNAYAKATVEFRADEENPGASKYYIRLAASDENSLNDNRISVSQGADLVAPDFVSSYKTGTDADPVYISVPHGATAQDLVSLINEDPNNTGMTASLIEDGTAENPYHITLTAKESGEDNRIELESNLSSVMTEKQGAETSLNASFSIDGIDYQRQSNDGLESLIQGVTLNLNKVGESQLTISPDLDDMKEKITQLVDTYNELIQDISSKIKYDSDEEKDGVLSNSSSAKALTFELSALIATDVNTKTDITSLLDLGIESNQDGTLNLDSKKLDAAFSASIDDVTRLFIGDEDAELKGLGDILNDRLTELTHTSGLINGEKSAAEGKISRLETNIVVAEERLDKRYEMLALQFVQLDAFIGTMNTQSQYLTSVFDAFNNSQNN